MIKNFEEIKLRFCQLGDECLDYYQNNYRIYLDEYEEKEEIGWTWYKNDCGKWVILFDGQDNYLTIPDSADWDLGSGDFIIDTQCKHNKLSLWRILLSKFRNFLNSRKGQFIIKVEKEDLAPCQHFTKRFMRKL